MQRVQDGHPALAVEVADAELPEQPLMGAPHLGWAELRVTGDEESGPGRAPPCVRSRRAPWSVVTTSTSTPGVLKRRTFRSRSPLCV